jgi:hypothetical protein
VVEQARSFLDRLCCFVGGPRDHRPLLRTMSVGDCEPSLDLRLQLAVADIQPMFIRNGFDWRTGLEKPRDREDSTMSENISRRRMLSLLGLGAALGFTLSGVLEPLAAKAQEAAPAVPNPTAPATGSAPAAPWDTWDATAARTTQPSQ